MFPLVISFFLSSVLCAEILYDGRAQPNFDAGVLDSSSGPYLTCVVSLLSGAPAERFGAQRGEGLRGRKPCAFFEPYVI